MSDRWQKMETSSHQDHVIAHVLDTTPLGYLIHDETIHLLLDIGFIWSIYLDGQMVLLPHPLAVKELQVDPVERMEIADDVDKLLSASSLEIRRLVPVSATAVLTNVEIYEDGTKRLFVLKRDNETLYVETSLESANIKVALGNL